MVPISAFWLPIVLSAVAVFFASWVAHMLLPHHRRDYRPLPDDETLLAPFRDAKVPPGNYVHPRSSDPKEKGSPETLEKYRRGPVVLVPVFPNTPPAMGKYLFEWFVFCLVISFFVAYVTGLSAAAGTRYVTVFRIASTVAFMGYAASYAIDSIWKGAAWGNTLRSAADGLVYALLTGGVLGWLWPGLTD